MLSEIWHNYLYQPTFNALIYIYNNWTDQSMGWAIVYLTILLRVVLLPFNVINVFNASKNRGLDGELQQITKDFEKDPVLMQEEARRVMRQRKVSPWAKVVVLGIQLLVLILLYDVFINGLRGDRIFKNLYTAINHPGVINTNFYGFILDNPRNIFWSALVAGLFFVELYMSHAKRKMATRADLSMVLLFPLAIFFVLYYLPMVKALFVFVSMVFSLIVNQILKIIFKPKPEKAKAAKSS